MPNVTCIDCGESVPFEVIDSLAVKCPDNIGATGVQYGHRIPSSLYNELKEAAAPTPVQTRIGLVGCASSKLSRPAPARELYTSQLFRKASAYAEATCQRWFILSAKHGLVEPDTVLEPYDMKLGVANRDPSKDPGPIWTWASKVKDQLDVALADVENPLLVTLAGAQYRTVLSRTPFPSEVPMEGLGIGEQLGWLTRELGRERPSLAEVVARAQNSSKTDPTWRTDYSA